MKHLFILTTAFLLIHANNAWAQHSFEKIFSNPKDQVIEQIIEDDEGNFVMAGRLRDKESGATGGYILKIDNQGTLIQEKIIGYSETNPQIFLDLHYFNGNYYTLGFRQFTNMDTVRIWYLKLNTNLDILSEKYSNIPEERWISHGTSIIDSDSNFVITGYTTRPDTTDPSPMPYNLDPFFYKLSLSGDSLASYFLKTSHHLTLSTSIIEKQDQSGYFAYGSAYNSSLPRSGQRFNLSKELDSIGIDTVPCRVDTYFSTKKLNDSTIIICGGGPGLPSTPYYSINVLTTSMENEAIDYNYFKLEEGNMRDYESIKNGVSKNGENIYIGGTSNFDYANPFFSSNDSWYHLIKVNEDLSPIWEYWYGGDAYYLLYSILATSDGGCIMAGIRYDDEIQNLERDIYISKVNSDGLVVWTREIEPPKSISTVYPNPGTDYFNIKTSDEASDFELINQNGQRVIKQHISEDSKQINTETLQPGMYFYKLTNQKTNTAETGKWIKNR